jgi:hypothetical protein
MDVLGRSFKIQHLKKSKRRTNRGSPRPRASWNECVAELPPTRIVGKNPRFHYFADEKCVLELKKTALIILLLFNQMDLFACTVRKLL